MVFPVVKDLYIKKNIYNEDILILKEETYNKEIRV